ncbi:MAG: hypothetical protein QG554_110 [Pseudomonadota bacterium]|nr:hypothetical protein [Pseudomonadota bacterium]
MLDFPYFQTNARLWTRRVAVWGLGVVLLGAALPGRTQGIDPDLPRRNLIVEWRMAGQGQTQDSSAGVRQGRIIIDSTRGVVAQGDVRLGHWQTQSQTRSVQQVQVLNGGRARLFVGRSQPYTVWQWAGGHGSHAQVWRETSWLDLGQGLDVRPSWPGGQAPVTVELQASASEQRSYEPDGQIRHNEVASTLSVSLGEWVVVARSGGRTQHTRNGTLSTEALDHSQSDQLEIRITAP